MVSKAGIAVAVASVALLVGCGSGSDTATTPTTSATLSTPAAASSTFPTASIIPTAGCPDAPPQIVIDEVNRSFTHGEHLEQIQAITGQPNAIYVGGNIVDGSGNRVSSSDSWAMVVDEVYALSSGARHNTDLPDGRDLPVHYDTWMQFNDRLSECVIDATKG